MILIVFTSHTPPQDNIMTHTKKKPQIKIVTCCKYYYDDDAAKKCL